MSIHFPEASKRPQTGKDSILLPVYYNILRNNTIKTMACRHRSCNLCLESDCQQFLESLTRNPFNLDVLGNFISLLTYGDYEDCTYTRRDAVHRGMVKSKQIWTLYRARIPFIQPQEYYLKASPRLCPGLPMPMLS